MDKVGDQWAHVAIETKVINKVEAESTADEVELKYIIIIRERSKHLKNSSEVLTNFPPFMKLSGK